MVETRARCGAGHDMLVAIGKPPAGEDLVDILLECHGRIRSFVAVAVALGAELAAHLDLEETVVFPAIRPLPDATPATIVEELRARRRR